MSYSMFAFSLRVLLVQIEYNTVVHLVLKNQGGSNAVSRHRYSSVVLAGVFFRRTRIKCKFARIKLMQNVQTNYFPKPPSENNHNYLRMFIGSVCTNIGPITSDLKTY